MLIDGSKCAAVVAAGVIFWGCSGTDTGTPSAVGGSISIGGSSEMGGTLGAGGTAASGGAAQSGGTSQTGGNSSTGGALNTGGTPSAGGLFATGGSKASGGTTATGGSMPTTTGGVSPTGGTKSAGGAATGGVSTTGGSRAAGGSATGGAATGGVSATGGSKAVGGSATGGSNATGGMAPTGGTTSAGGGGAVFKCSNLPPGTGSTGVAQPSGTPGNLQVINWAGYKGAGSFTHDDTLTSQIVNYSKLNAFGIKYTFYLITNSAHITDPVWQQAVTDGHEIGNHTNDHNTISAANIDTATTYIKQHFGVTPYTFAAPNGTNGATGYEQYANTRFLIDRGVSGSVIMPNAGTDQWNLPCYIPATGATTAAILKPITDAQSAGGWSVLLVHGFTGFTCPVTNPANYCADGAYQPVDITQYTDMLTQAKALTNMWLDRVDHVGSYWVGQRVVSKVTPTTSGSDKVYSWSWPSIYPPNSCLRVKFDGGTPKQNGTALTWDTHGYYEMSLDAESLTLSP